AIADDWWVVSVTEIGREHSDSVVVEAEIAGPGGTATGTFSVETVDDEWMVSDPFAKVRFPASPLSFIRVNDAVEPYDGATADHQTFSLLPGLYRFYDSVPGVVSVRDAQQV